MKESEQTVAKSSMKEKQCEGCKNGRQGREREQGPDRGRLERGLGGKERGAMCTGVNWGNKREWERRLKRKGRREGE